MGDNSLGVPGLYHFCQKHGIFFYSVIGAVYSDASTPARRAVMDFLGRRNLAVYKKTPAYAKTPAAAAQLAAAGVPCAGVLPVGLDTAVIPKITQSKAVLRQKLGLEAQARYFVFAGRLDAYKRPLELAEILAAAPGWRAVVIGRGEMAAALDARMAQAGLAGRYRRIPELANAAVHEYYHACDAYVNCNDHEIFGMSLLEAMWAGCPVVARRAPGPELLLGAVQADVQTGAFPLGAVQIDASSPGVPGQNPPSPSGCGALPCGILVEKTSEYPAALERVAAHPEMGAAAHARVQAHFLWDAGAAQALAMLRQKGVLCDG
jgi:1,2-diacylglycerol 3-alpha-glucosyltransferase